MSDHNISSLNMDYYTREIESSLTPYILEEREMRVTQMDIFSRLMRKTLDANSFISEEVRKTLILVSTNCNEGKVLSMLNNFHTSRANPIKINIVHVLE